MVTGRFSLGHRSRLEAADTPLVSANHYVECSEPTTIPERVGDEVDRPAIVDGLASHQRQRMACWDALLAAPPAIQVHQATHPPDPFMVSQQAAATDDLKQLVEAALRETLRQLGQQRDDFLVAIRARFVAQCG